MTTAAADRRDHGDEKQRQTLKIEKKEVFFLLMISALLEIRVKILSLNFFMIF